MSNKLIETVYEIGVQGREKEVLFLNMDEEPYNGREIHLQGKKLVNYGSYSYLGLETDNRLIQGAIQAIQKYGIQFPSSRGYVSCPLYPKLEANMEKIFGFPTLLSTSTTIGHLAVMPVIANKGSVIILDQQVHASVQSAARICKHEGALIDVVRHNNMEQLEKKIQQYATKCQKVFYCADGVYSMYGDTAPMDELIKLLERYKNLYVLIDDAHGMTWTGAKGAGFVLDKIKVLHPRMILATSMNKGFAAGGGAYVIPDTEMRDLAKVCGAPFIFAGQHQVSALGAGLACSEIHLSSEIILLQVQYKKKIQYCYDLLLRYGLPIISNNETPIFFVGVGIQKIGYEVVNEMIKDRCYVNLSIFPAVAENCTGIRFTITNKHTYQDIENIVLKLAYHLNRVLAREKYSLLDIKKSFRKVKEFYVQLPKSMEQSKQQSSFTTSVFRTIQEIPETVWNHYFANKCTLDWKGLVDLEKAFTGNEKREENWKFYYVKITDQQGTIVSLSFFTITLTKDDILAPAETSKQIEEQYRKTNLYYLSSYTMMMGSLLTLGEHIYLDLLHADWQAIMKELIQTVGEIRNKEQANSLQLRDFYEVDHQFKDYFMNYGFLKVNMSEDYVIDMCFSNTEDYLASLSSKQRYFVRRRAVKLEGLFTVKLGNEVSEEEIALLYQLYLNTQQRSYELNEYAFPKKLLVVLLASENWELLRVCIDNQIVGFALSYIQKDGYHFSITGMDYAYLESHQVYSQLLWQLVKRTIQLKKKQLHLGITGAQNKRKFGAKAQNLYSFNQVDDKYNLNLIQQMGVAMV